jgi:hypothetical protein
MFILVTTVKLSNKKKWPGLPPFPLLWSNDCLCSCSSVQYRKFCLLIWNVGHMSYCQQTWTQVHHLQFFQNMSAQSSDVSCSSNNFVLVILCIVRSQFTTLNQQNTLCSTLDVYIEWNTDTCFHPHVIVIRECVSNNMTLNSGSYFLHIWTSYLCCKGLKCTAVVEYLCT